jgi:hypothetical protein
MNTFWTWTKRVAVSLAVLVLVMAVTGFAYRAYQLRRVAIATSIDRAKGLDEAMFVRIGGIDPVRRSVGPVRSRPT